MNDQALIHQLKAVDSACRRLQSSVAGDPKSAGTLGCIRSLLVKLILDRSLKAQLDDDARAQFKTLKADIEAIAEDRLPAASYEDVPIMQVVRDAVVHLQSIESPAAHNLVERLIAIETQSLDTFERRFIEASADSNQASEIAAASYSTGALGQYLSSKVFADPDLSVTSIEVISGGYSKLTLRATLNGGREIPGKVILRVDRSENQKFVGTHVSDEYPVLVALHKAGVIAPRPYALEASGTVLGAPAIVLGEAAGTTVGDLFDFPPPDRSLGKQLAQQLALIHGMPQSIVAKNSATVEEGIVAAIRQEISGFRAGWNALARPSAIIEAAFHCIELNMHFAEGRYTFIHGDFGLHNVLVEQGRITAVLDWEFARLANPAIDLGWVYNTADHLVGWETFLSDYADAGGIVPPQKQVKFYRLWGALRFAILCSQVDAGFDAGQLLEIDYAVPGNRYFRVQAMRVADALNAFQKD